MSKQSLKRCAVLASTIVWLMPTFGWAANAPQFTAEERAWIASHPVVRTRILPHWRPFEFRENGKVVGVVPSYLAVISQISGLRFEYVDDIAWRDSADALRTGRIDIVPDVAWLSAHNALNEPDARAALGVTASDDATSLHSNSIVSRPYFVGTVLVVAPEHMNLFVDSRNLAGRRVAIKGGGELEAAIRRSDIPMTLLTYDDERDALAAVSDGDADVAIGPDMSVLPLLQRQYRNKLFVSGGLPDTPYALAIATRRDMPVLAAIIDKSLAAISARDAEIVARQWIEAADYGKPSLHSILYYRRTQVAAAGAGLLALVAIAFVSWRARVSAVRSERDKAMFLAFISHEIRTPMHTILSSLELMQRSKLAPKQAARANAAVAASESLLTLLDDVLEYSRLESRNVTLSPEPTQIEPWVRSSVEMVRWRVDEKGLNLSLEFACPTSLTLLIDPVRTRQIVLNLLVNAIKFTSNGAIGLRVDYLEGNTGTSDTLAIEVHDTGIGIPPERQRRIFEPYQRVEEPGSRRVSGSGLGLSICRELVDLMNGKITVSSSPDRGTVFTVTLPARRTALTAVSDTAEPQAPTHEAATLECGAPQQVDEGPMILVVDDHEAVQHAIGHQLGALACRSMVAGNGAQALDQFKRLRYDMVLLDCDLPDLDGYTVAQRMRASEQQCGQEHTPIIAISASTDDAHRERCFDSGMDGVLGKPLRLESLRKMIDLWCPASKRDALQPPVGQTPATGSDFPAIYRQSVDADLALLAAALSAGDADRACHAAHRIKGAAAIAGHIGTSELADELERGLQAASGGIPASAGRLHQELLRRHRIETIKPDTGERKPGNTDA